MSLSSIERISRVKRMNETMRQWVKQSGKKCKDCGEGLTNIEVAYCENLHAVEYLCINCLAKKYYLYPKI